jgi:Uma2 family endonuclease
LVALLSARLRVKVLFFGSSTMTRERKSKGAEPDACFYVQSAGLIAGKSQLDLRSDPPPDVVVEIDLRHESHSKLPLYAGLGVPEVWRYDGEAVTIFRLQEEQYVPAAASVALPMLSAEILTRFLNLSRDKDQYEVTLAFEEWLDTLR